MLAFQKLFAKKCLQILKSPKPFAYNLKFLNYPTVSFDFSEAKVDHSERAGSFIPKYTRSTSGKSFMSLEGNSKSLTLSELNTLITDKELLSPFVKNMQLPLKFDLINEGAAKLIRSPDETNVDPTSDHDLLLYYNFCSIVERDLSLLIMKNYIEQVKETAGSKFNGVRILDGNSESGIRTLRILKELNMNDINMVVANDPKPYFLEAFKLLTDLNKINDEKLIVQNMELNEHFFECRKMSTKTGVDSPKYHIIDLDNLNSSMKYLDGALQSIEDDGLICATFSDANVLIGDETVKCAYYYGSSRTKNSSLHENAIRLLYYSINSMASKYYKQITPVISFSSDFYFKLYFKVKESKSECRKALANYSQLLTCTGCPNVILQPLGRLVTVEETTKAVPSEITQDLNKCEVCQSKLVLNGPIWNKDINDLEFVKKLFVNLETLKRESSPSLRLQSALKIEGVIVAILKEKELGKIPMAYSFVKIGKFLKTRTWPNKFLLKRAIENLGYKLVRSYLYPGLWKSNAPNLALFDIIKSWKYKTTAREKITENMEPGSAAAKYLLRPTKYIARFKSAEKKEDESDDENIGGDDVENLIKEVNIDKIENKPIFFPNPSGQWGPQKRIKPKKKASSTGQQEKDDD